MVVLVDVGARGRRGGESPRRVWASACDKTLTCCCDDTHASARGSRTHGRTAARNQPSGGDLARQHGIRSLNCRDKFIRGTTGLLHADSPALFFFLLPPVKSNACRRVSCSFSHPPPPPPPRGSPRSESLPGNSSLIPNSLPCLQLRNRSLQ